jgi:translocation and assembly module TamA
MRLWPWILSPTIAFSLAYQVQFVGVDDPMALKALQDSSALVSLISRPPASINGLRYRAINDIPGLIRTLHALAYYDASIEPTFENDGDLIQVALLVSLGVQYKLSSYDVFNGDCRQIAIVPHCEPLTPEVLNLQIGQAALSTDIVNAELNLLTELSRCGYPLAYIDKRRVEVDLASKTVMAASCVSEGPLSKFGPVTMFGLEHVKPRFIEQKIDWEEGDIYDSDAITKTQERLLKTELFSSVYISHGDTLDDQGELPIRLRLTEAKHKRVTLGVYWATVDGPGGTFAWTNRNTFGMGEIVSAKGDFSKRFLAGNIALKIPDFLKFDQTLRSFIELSRLNIRAYIAFIYRGAAFLDWKMSERGSLSLGLKVEHINISDSAAPGTYLLTGLPFFAKYFAADEVLDPSKGYALIYSMTPYQSLFYSNQHFAKQRFTANFYIPLAPNKRLTLALRFQAGSIAGAKQKDVPISKLFLGGSEDDLRGYRYKTVGPLNEERKPLGGRSAIFCSVEGRLRITKTIGVVPFADFGTVTFSQWPKFDEKWFKSVGAGVRYFAFFGPLRFDVGFPLDRRKGIDPKFQIYASVGQAF